MNTIHTIIAGSRSKPIGINLFINHKQIKAPVVVFCHGYKGFKDWGSWNSMGEYFAQKGYNFISFNFSYNGTTLDNPLDFDDLEAFGNNNYVTELNDLEKVLGWIVEQDGYAKYFNVSELYIIGHSRGGGIVTIKASEDTRVKKVVSWAGVSDYYKRLPSEDDLDKWKKEGVLYEYNSRTKQKMPIYYQFYESMKANWERLSIENAAKSIQIPHLIVHGADDKVVTVLEAERLKEWNPKAELVIIEDTAHTFDTKHPADDNIPLKLLAVIDKTMAFFTEK